MPSQPIRSWTHSDWLHTEQENLQSEDILAHHNIKGLFEEKEKKLGFKVGIRAGFRSGLGLRVSCDG